MNLIKKVENCLFLNAVWNAGGFCLLESATYVMINGQVNFDVLLNAVNSCLWVVVHVFKGRFSNAIRKMRWITWSLINLSQLCFWSCRPIYFSTKRGCLYILLTKTNGIICTWLSLTFDHENEIDCNLDCIGGIKLPCIMWSLVDTHKSVAVGFEFDHIRL